MFNFQVKKLSKVCLLPIAYCLLLASCSVQKQISHSAQKVIKDSSLLAAHLGISIFEPAAGKYWYNYQGDKYFVPASNTKIPTCYAAMKYLGDSLVGLKYGFSDANDTYAIILAIQPTGDPTLLHSDFKNQPAWNFISQKAKQYKYTSAFLDTVWKDERWGSGWSWNDYNESYMAERSSMPIFGNVLNIKLKKVSERFVDSSLTRPVFNVFKTQSHFFDSLINSDFGIESNVVYWNNETVFSNDLHWGIKRKLDENRFELVESRNKLSTIDIPIVTNGSVISRLIISDSLKLDYGYLGNYGTNPTKTEFLYTCPSCRSRKIKIMKWYKIHSQPTDSLFKPMMHRSDNFFAEQVLLMVSNEKLGVMNDEKIIDTLLKTDFKDLPQKPRWVDGSGLSRYNLFTPQDFVSILNKMKNEFGMDRIKVIFPTGGEGTLSNYYKADSNYLFAKTGTLSGVVALSGYLYTKKNKLLIFSVLANNHQASATAVRRAVEKFLQGIRSKY